MSRTTWREHEDENERTARVRKIMRDHGTLPERLVGWLLTYPVRTLVVTFIIVLLLTFACGL